MSRQHSKVQDLFGEVREINRNMRALLRERGPRRANGVFHTSLFQGGGQRLQAGEGMQAGEWLQQVPWSSRHEKWQSGHMHKRCKGEQGWVQCAPAS